MLRREGTDIKVLEMFYREVVQAVLLFGSESGVLLSAMVKTVERAHTGFLHQITGKRVRRNSDGTWVKFVVGDRWESEGIQSKST